MKKLILNSLSFLGIFIIFYSISLWALGSFAVKYPMLSPINFKYPVNGNGHMHSRFIDFKELKEADIVFMGASTCYRHYDVRVFEEAGYKVFNFGSSGQSPIQTFDIYQEYVGALQPKLIIFDVNPQTFCVDGIESQLDILANTETNSSNLNSTLSINHTWTYNAFYFSLMTSYLGPDKEKEPTSKYDDTYINNGFVETNKTENSRSSAGANKTLLPKEIQINSFLSLISAFNKDKQDFILVQSPVTKMEYATIQNASEIDFELEKHGEYYNFNNILDLNDKTDFMDLRHMNSSGATKFSKKILELINL